MSTVLATVDSNMETLSELKSMFTKFMNVYKESDSGSSTKSHSLVHQQTRGKVIVVISVAGLDLPVVKSDTREKEKEKSLDNSVHFADQDETPASVATCRKEGTAITNDISPVSEVGDLVDSFLDFDGVSGSEANAQLIAAEALTEISSPKSDMEAKKNIQDAKVAIDAKDTTAPIQPAQSKVCPLLKGSPSNQECTEVQGEKEPERESRTNPYSMTPSLDIQ